MSATLDISAWTSLLLGGFALAACLGEFRRPGLWRKMIQEILASPAIQFVVGILELLLGALVFLINPWAPQDWLACFMKIIGGIMILEALVMLALADIYLGFWDRRLGSNIRAWTVVALLVGVWLTAAGIHRLT